jgi:hypothetical protein
VERWIKDGYVLLVRGIHEQWEIAQPHLKLDTKQEALARIIGWPRVGPSASRRYTLRTYGSERGQADFYTGTTPAGEQVLLGTYDDAVVCVRFDAEGEQVGVDSRPLLADAPLEELSAKQRAKLEIQAVKAWRGEIGLRPGPIRVCKFLLSEPQAYISDYPNWAIQLHYDPDQFAGLERQEMRRLKEEWEAAGNFVFWWGKDYHMSKEGDVLST